MSLRSRFFRFVLLFLFSKQNKNAGSERHNIDEENSRPELQTEAEQAVEDQINREQNHTDVLVKFHDVEIADCLLT